MMRNSSGSCLSHAAAGGGVRSGPFRRADRPEQLLAWSRCPVAGSFILVHPDGPRSIPSTVLGAVGLDLERDFHEVGTFERSRPAFRGTPEEPAAPTTVYAPNGPLTPCGE